MPSDPCSQEIVQRGFVSGRRRSVGGTVGSRVHANANVSLFSTAAGVQPTAGGTLHARRDAPCTVWRSRKGAGAGVSTGFTLLELLVVLVLVGLVTALALPNLERLVGAVTSKTERDYILDQFAGLGRHAMLQRRAYVVFGSDRAQDAGFSDTAERDVDLETQNPCARPDEDRSDSPSCSGHDRYVIDLPEGWELRFDEPLVVYANGLCLGAELALYRRGEEDSRHVLEPPYCRIAPDA